MDELYQRRLSDQQGEKLVKLESEVVHVKEAVNTIGTRLEEHIESNSKGFAELREHMQSLATSAKLQNQSNEMQANTMRDLADTLSALSKNDMKVNSLEEFRMRTELHLSHCDTQHHETEKKLTRTTELIARLYWGVPILIVVVGFLIEVLDTLHRSGALGP